ncbi:MAG TPA: glycoside hydrolase domain-containing protein [Bryobacteraceae bacterium]|nr:glycoside hydrolase domain-containing protein [Bryobacteraceae bacterium]
MTPQPPLTPPAFAGFDADAYPGDAHMRIWKTASPYVFTGYYLHAPCHGDRGWMGHRAALKAMGWNIVPIYVGQQVAGVSPCKSSVLTSVQGTADALDCVKTMTAEGFSKGCFVYLDVERSDLFPNTLRDYVSAWIPALVAGGFGPGVYCHKHNAPDVRATVVAALTASPEVKPRFWIVGGATGAFDAPKSQPSGSGIAFADMWQRPSSLNQTFGGVEINIDEDLATVSDPARPDPAQMPPASAGPSS